MFEENVSIVDLGQDGQVRQVFQGDDTNEPIACFTCHPAQEELVVATQKSSLIHVNSSGEKFRTFKAHQMPILCMAYDPTGMSCSSGKRAKVASCSGANCQLISCSLLYRHPSSYGLCGSHRARVGHGGWVLHTQLPRPHRHHQNRHLSSQPAAPAAHHHVG